MATHACCLLWTLLSLQVWGALSFSTGDINMNTGTGTGNGAMSTGANLYTTAGAYLNNGGTGGTTGSDGIGKNFLTRSQIEDMKKVFFMPPSRFEGKDFYVSKVGTRNYWVAVMTCKMIGTRILEITTETELFRIRSLLDEGSVKQYNIKAFYIGLTDLQLEGKHVFQTSGLQLAFYQWGCHQHPPRDTSRNCVGLVEWCAWGMYVMKCDLSTVPTGFICEVGVNDNIKAVATFDIIKESFFFYPIAADKSDFLLSRLVIPDVKIAIFACQMIAGHLAQIDTEETFLTIRSAIEISFKDYYPIIFISGTDSDKENEWVHQGKKDPLKFTKFNHKFPKGGRYANCLVIRDGWEMEDASCQRRDMTHMDSFMCQVPQDQDVSSITG